jgi:TPR repeat protein
MPAPELEALRERASHNEISAMEELGRRLLQGADMPKDPQAGAGWLLRAANLGSAQSAFNIGVMYERGFVVERDSSKAAEWYRKAADAGIPAARHNLALMLREGKGVARDTKAASQLFLSAARQGMAASMFSLGDMYEQGDGGNKDNAVALAWFAITGEFERQTNRGTETALAKTAALRAQVLKRTLTTAELERAQELAQGEFRRIAAELATPPPAPSKPSSGPDPAPQSLPAPADDNALAWPRNSADQVRAVQQVLFDLKRLRDKPDGTLGPATRNAIRDFQKAMGLKQTGEPSSDLFLALVSARADVVRESPLPAPPPAAVAAPKIETPKVEAPKVETPKVEPPKVEPPKPAPVAKADDSKIDLGKVAPPPPPPSSSEIAALVSPNKVEPSRIDPPRIDPPKPPPVVVDPAKPVMTFRDPPAPPPPTSADIAKADPDAWPQSRVDQVKAVQTLLRDLRFYGKAIDGQAKGDTLAAIREYQRMSGQKETGEVNKALFEQLKDMRKLMAPVKN